MAGKVTANGKMVATTGSGHMAWATKPDVCKLPNGKPKEFPNWVLSKELKSGKPVHTRFDSKHPMTAAGVLGPPSHDPHAGVGGGVTSQTYLGPAKATQYSDNVIVEGKGVVRKDDKTVQNTGNTEGQILLEADLAALLAAFKAKYGDGDGTGDDDGDNGKKAEKGRDGDKGKGKAKDDKPKTDPTEGKDKQCYLNSAQLVCSHNRTPNAAGELQIAPKTGGDELKLTAVVHNSCGQDHPLWTIHNESTGGSPTTLKGIAQTYKAKGFESEITLGRILGIEPKRYTVQVQAHQGGRPTFAVLAFPSWKISQKLMSADGLKGTLEDRAAKIQSLLKLAPGGVEIKWKFLVGELSIAAEWKELTDWRAGCYLSLTAKYAPFFGVTGKAHLTALVPAIEGLRKFLEYWELGTVDAYIELSASIGLEGTIGVYVPAGGVEGSMTANGKIGITLGIKIGGSVLGAETKIGSGAGVQVKITGTVEGMAANGVMDGKTWVDPIKGTVSVTVDIGFKIEKKKEVNFIDGIDPLSTFGPTVAWKVP